MGAISRRPVLAALAVLSLAACNQAGGGKSVPDDMAMGDPNAKVTVIEYASVACPHCAEFNNTVFPAFKAKYIDTGKVHYVAREILTGNPTLAAAGFLLARCAGKDKYFFVTDAIYRAQDQIYEPGTDNMRPNAGQDVLLPIAQSAGLTPDQFTKCLSDEAAAMAMNDRIDKAARKDDVQSTPTFIINGKKMSPGEKTLAELDAVIQPLLK
jgi:protein-disulfide isomerase